MKKDKKHASWINQLLDGSLELIFCVFVIAMALILASLLPSNLLEDVLWKYLSFSSL